MHYKIHKLRAKECYLLLKEEKEESITFCSDMQQVQCLANPPIGIAFYLRQLAFFCFSVTNVKSEHPVFYTTPENLAGCGSSEEVFIVDRLPKTNLFSCYLHNHEILGGWALWTE
ncbi:hypothetical protein QE152_g10860 [Popillia japonica]|uniref:Uncharacterized protein n=1 Tax=Popillia japonica TaxID=7064 RepID=A0AAW1LSE1_POPJA